MSSIIKGSSPYLGVFNIGDPSARVDDFTANTGNSVSIVHTHLDWATRNADGSTTLLTFDDPDPGFGTSVTELVSDLEKKGTVLAVSWDPLALNFQDDATFTQGADPAVNMNDILSGSYDAYIRQVAQQVADMGVPIMMSLFGESDAAALMGFGADGQSFQQTVDDTTGQYGDPALLDGAERVRDVFRHVIDIFDQEGADNVTWYMYTSSGYSSSDPESIPKDILYPGDDYIDWVGQSVYVKDASGLAADLDDGYNAWHAITKNPFFVPEFGTETGGQADWQALLDGLAGYDNIGAVTITEWDGLDEIYGLAPVGSQPGDWQAIAGASAYADVVTVDMPQGIMAFDSWRDEVGRSDTDHQFVGTSGADFMIGDSAADTLIGMGGNDTYIIDGAGDSILESYDGGTDDVLASVTYTLQDNVENVFIQGDTGAGATGNDLGNLIAGDESANNLNGGGGDDTVFGAGGNDVIQGGWGHDLLSGDGGDDTINGNSGNDNIDGGFGNDSLNGGAMDDFLLGGFGFDVLQLGDGNDFGSGGSGADTIFGGAGEDMIQGDAGNDRLLGSDGDDILEGGDGNDVLIGGSGTDAMSGGAGDDQITLDGGADYVTGGEGADTFIFGAVNELAVIDDFEVGIDRLDLSLQPIASRAELIDASFDIDGSVLVISGGSFLVLTNVGMDDLDTIALTF